MSVKKIISFMLAVVMFMMGIRSVSASYEAKLTATNETVTAGNVPPDSTLIAAIYDNNVLVDVMLYKGEDTITANFAEDMRDSMKPSSTFKAFLWDMKTFTPLSVNIDAVISSLPSPSPGEVVTPTPTPIPTPMPVPEPENNVLIAYFSWTNNTEGIANHIAEITGADKYKIIPKEPYGEENNKYYDQNTRAYKEQYNNTARPEIDGTVENMSAYDVIFLGYPIWYGKPPKIIYTFLESYDFTGKTIIPFCTSGSSGISWSELIPLAEGANWLDGKRFDAKASESEISSWIDSLDLPEKETTKEVGKFNFDTKTVLLNSGYEMPINGLGTYSLHGDTCVNSVKSALQSGVRLIDTASMYGNEAEVGQGVREAMAEYGIKREDIFVITKIYPGSQMANPEQSIQDCIDKLNIDYVDMMLLHHPDPNDVKAYKAMEKFVEEGKIHSIGLSNWYIEELTDFLPQVDTPPALVQNEIHPYYQENDVIPFIQSKGIVVQGWYPFGGRGYTSELLGDSVISAIAQTHGVSSAQVILRWNLQKSVVVIPGSSNPDHIKENNDIYGFELTDNEIAQINALDRNEKHDWY